MRKSNYTVLLVDDSEDDRAFMKMALRKHGRFVVVGELEDGEKAISYIGGKGDFKDRLTYPFPDLVMLDLKMPRRTGHEVLEWLRAHSINGLRVIVVSGAFLPEDKERCASLGAFGFYKKNALKEELQALIEAVEDSLDKTGSGLVANPGHKSR